MTTIPQIRGKGRPLSERHAPVSRHPKDDVACSVRVLPHQYVAFRTRGRVNRSSVKASRPRSNSDRSTPRSTASAL